MIGTAMISQDKLDQFFANEMEKYRKKENSWIGEHWEGYFYHMQKIFGRAVHNFYFGSAGLVHEPNERMYKKIQALNAYLVENGLSWDLLYRDDIACMIRCGKITVVLPSEIVKCREYENLDNYTIEELKGLTGISGSGMEATLPALPGALSSISRKSMINSIHEKQQKIEEKKTEMEQKKAAMKEEIERARREIEEKYKVQMDQIQEMQDALAAQMAQLEAQLFLLDTQLYSIRCFMGETVQFTKLLSGKPEEMEEPVVLYQKLRFLDEEMGKFLSLYDFDWSGINLFEDALRYREDIRDIFAPPGKSISIIRISRNNIQFFDSDKAGNMLEAYEAYHGRKIGILVRNGENLYIGWTDEDKISIPGENAFLQPKTEENAEDYRANSTKEEIASRYFIFSILQGVLGKFLDLPKGTSVFTPNKYVVLSMAEGWIEDIRFGSFADIVERTNNQPLQVGDQVLTTIRITRDDIYDSFTGKSTRYQKYNNNRGRGDKNRTHDAVLKNNTIYRINVIDVYEYYTIHCEKYRSLVTEKYGPEIRLEGGGIARNVSHIYERTNELIDGSYSMDFTVENGYISGIQKPDYDVRGLSDDQVYARYLELDTKLWRSFLDDHMETSFSDEGRKGYYLVPKGFSKRTDKEYFISAPKQDSVDFGRKACANLQVFPNEYLNLTYLNSVYVEYALRNKKIGGWMCGNTAIDYAASIKYLKQALAFLRKREELEAEMLTAYMDLYPEWQVDVSEWRLQHGYHKLTLPRAKKFAKKVKQEKIKLK